MISLSESIYERSAGNMNTAVSTGRINMVHIFSFSTYIICTVFSLLLFYYLVSHLLHSKHFILNVVSSFLLLGCAKYHFNVAKTGALPIFNITIDSGGVFIAVLIPFIFSLSYSVPFYMAYKRYY